jgi:glycosyltransferase involved in cell wall biosynthesis
MVLESVPLPRWSGGAGESESQASLNSLYYKREDGRFESVQKSDLKPLISIITPAYNESLLLERSLEILCHYLSGLEQDYRWEIVVVNDGSSDNTAELAEAFAKTRSNVRVIHHLTNFGLGQALRTGFDNCQGDYIITLDLDLSYAPEYIEQLLDRMRQTQAQVVVTSPYMKGGKVSNVPWLRRELSVWANRFLSFTARHSVATLTGMVRAYDANFLRSLHLRSKGMEVNPEVLHKAMLLDARVEEIPAHLNWSFQKSQNARHRASSTESPLHSPTHSPTKKVKQRKSSMKMLKQIWATLYYGFVFRPVMFFILPSLLFFVLAVYSNVWVLIHCWNNYHRLAQVTPFPDPTEAVAAAFQQAPHTFFIGGIMLMLSIQLFSLGVLAVQSKRYFEEIFYLGTAIYRSTRPNQPEKEEQM